MHDQVVKKPILIRVLLNSVGFVILLWFFGYLWSNRELFYSLKNVPFSSILAILVLVFLNWVVVSSQSLLLFRQLGTKIGFFECLALTLASTFANYLPMRVGTFVRAHYMKVKYQLDYSQFGSVVSMRLVLTLAACGACGISVFILFFEFSFNFLPLIILFSLIILVPALVLFYLPVSVSAKHPVVLIWNKFSEGVSNLRSRPIVTAVCLALVVLQLIFVGARFLIAAQIAGHEVNFQEIMMLVSIATIAGFLAITPGGLGVREVLMGYGATLVGTSFSLGLLIGTIDRVLLLCLTLVFGGSCFVYIWCQFNRFHSAALRSSAEMK